MSSAFSLESRRIELFINGWQGLRNTRHAPQQLQALMHGTTLLLAKLMPVTEQLSDKLDIVGCALLHLPATQHRHDDAHIELVTGLSNTHDLQETSEV